MLLLALLQRYKFYLKETSISNLNLPAKLDNDSPGEEENRSTLTEHNRQSLQNFSFTLHVHFNKWIGSYSMATALIKQMQ